MSFALLPSNDKPDIAYNLKLSEDLLSKFINSASCKLIVKDSQLFFKFTNKDGSSFTYDTNFLSESAISRIYISENPAPSQANLANNHHIDGIDVVDDGMDLINDVTNKSYNMIADLTERISIFGSGIRRLKSGTENVLNATAINNNASFSVNSRSNSSTSNSGTSSNNNLSSNSLSPDIPNQSPTPPPQSLQTKQSSRKQVLVAVSNLNIKMSPENRIIHLMALGPNSIPLIQKRCKISNYDLIENVVAKFCTPISESLQSYMDDSYPTYSNLPSDFDIAENSEQSAENVFYVLKDSTYQYLRIWTWKYSANEREKILLNVKNSFDRLKIPESDPIRNLLIDPKILKENQIKEQESRELERQKQHELKKQDLLKKQTQFLEHTSKANDNKSPKITTPRSPLLVNNSSSSSAKKAITSSPCLIPISDSKPSILHSKLTSVSAIPDTTSSKSLFSTSSNISKGLQESAPIISRKRSVGENNRLRSNIKRRKRSKIELKQLISFFKEKYATYKEIHNEINTSRDDDTSPLVINLIKKWVHLHNELIEIRETLWSEQPNSSDEETNSEKLEDLLKADENSSVPANMNPSRNYILNNGNNTKSNSNDLHSQGNSHHNRQPSNNSFNGSYGNFKYSSLHTQSAVPSKLLGVSPKISSYSNTDTTLGSSSLSSFSNSNNGSSLHVPSLPSKPIISGIRPAPSNSSHEYHGDALYRSNNNIMNGNRNGAGLGRKGGIYNNSSSHPSSGRSFGSSSSGNHHGYGHDGRRMRMSQLFK